MKVSRTFVIDARRVVVAATNGTDENAKRWATRQSEYYSRAAPVTPEYDWMTLPLSIVCFEAIDPPPFNEPWAGRVLPEAP